jgi:predicted DNA-binding transcriptional regulator AlpA
MATPQLYTRPEVAEILGCSLATLPAKWRRLHQRHGFPRPLPGRADAWSRVLVDEWIATPETERGRPTPRRERAVAQQREALEQRYAGGQA